MGVVCLYGDLLSTAENRVQMLAAQLSMQQQENQKLAASLVEMQQKLAEKEEFARNTDELYQKYRAHFGVLPEATEQL